MFKAKFPLNGNDECWHLSILCLKQGSVGEQCGLVGSIVLVVGLVDNVDWLVGGLVGSICSVGG